MGVLTRPISWSVSGGGPAIALLGTSSGETSFGTINSFTIAYPTTLVATDTAVVTVATLAADTTPTISGMTQAASFVVGTAARLTVFTGDGFTGTGSWTVSYTASGDSVRRGLCSVWSGADEANIVVGATTAANSGGDGALTWASVTSASAGLLLALAMPEYDTTTMPTSLSPAHTQAGSNHGAMQHWYADDSTVGASGTVTGTMQAWFNFGSVYLAIPGA